MKHIVKLSIIFSLIITSLLFILGFGLSYAFDFLRIDEISNIHDVTLLQSDSYLLEQEFYSINNGKSCALMDKRLWVLRDQIITFSKKMNIYSGQSVFSKSKFDIWRRKFFQSELDFFYYYQLINENCEKNKDLVLFFYQPEDEQSITQSYILSELNKELNGSLVILSFDVEFEDEPALIFLKKKYNITTKSLYLIQQNTKLPILTYRKELIAELSK